MGVCVCEYHGKTGIAFVCSHIKKDIQNRTKSKAAVKANFPVQLDAEEKYQANLVLKYCFACVAEYDFPNTDCIISEAEFDSMYAKNFTTACHKCFKELNC